MQGRIALAAIAALALSLAAPAAALAGTPGHWTRVTPTTGQNIDQVDLVRTADGALHVAWRAKNATDPTKEDLFQSTVQTNGTVNAPAPVELGWATLENPAIVLDPGGLRTFWGGIRTTDPGETQTELSTATAPASGSPWTLTPGNVVKDDASYGGNAAATVAGGQFWQTWAGTSGVWVHRGLDENTPDANLQDALGGCCGYDPGIVTEPAGGAPVVAWASNASGKTGVWAQALDPASGNPVGAPALMPGSATNGNTNQQLARTPIAVRPGKPGAYVAYPGNYPTTTRVIVWKVGAPRSAVVASGAGEHRTVTLAGAADGRVWVLWEQRQASGAPRVYARRSNPAVTSWGETVSVAPPAGATDGWNLDADAQPAVVDVVGSFTTQPGIAAWHTQLRPGLTLRSRGVRARRGGRVTIRVQVLDAGDPLTGATVRAAGLSAKTDKSGNASLSFRRGKRRSTPVTATLRGYVPASLTLRL
jgi:hypothetical protein